MHQHDKSTGFLIVLVGPSGVGKSTVINNILVNLDFVHRLVTCTTRPIRPGEINGKEHWFIPLQTFKTLIEENGFIEYKEVFPGRYYGLPKKETIESLADGKILITDLEISGARTVAATMPNLTVEIFLKPRNLETLAERIQMRSIVDEQELQLRLDHAIVELAEASKFRYEIVNDNLDDTIQWVSDIIREETEVRRTNGGRDNG